MNCRWIPIASLALLAAAGCARKDERNLAGRAPAPVPPPAQEVEPPAAKTASVSIAAADFGGAVEELTDNYGPGFTGRRLIDGPPAPAWIVDTRKKPQYRIRVDALGQVLEDSLVIAANETTAISLGVDGDRFVLRR